MDSWLKLATFAQSNSHVQKSLEIIEKSFFTYKFDESCISFNGGKDCTALLHLVHSVATKLQLNNNDYKLRAFYAQLPNHFEQESAFVTKTVTRYNLKLMRYPTKSLKESLTQLKSDSPTIKAIFVGTRQDDLRKGMSMDVFAPTDANWPQFMRVNPILDWSYNQVWAFIRELKIPYCDLYNQGYSSLGTKIDTSKNSSLLRYDAKGEPYYLPAWNLIETHEERMSRSSSLDMTNKSQSS